MNYESLTQNVLNAPLGGARMSNVAEGAWNLTIDGDKVFLSAPKKASIPVTDNGVAAMRIATDAATAKKYKTTREARESGEIVNLQTAIRTEQVKGLSASTKFEVVHRLQIEDAATGQVILNNDCYNGYPDYVKAARKAARLDGTERQDAFAAALEVLRASGIKAGKSTTDPKNIQHMPVFVVS